MVGNYYAQTTQPTGASYQNTVICPDCDGELIKRISGKWCPRCRGWLNQHTRLNGTQYMFIQNYQPKYS